MHGSGASSTPIWLIPRTRAALGPSSSRTTRSATTSRSAGDSSRNACSSGSGSPSPNASSSASARSREYVSSRRFRRDSARNQSIATERAIRQSHVRGEPRRGSKRRHIRNAFSNVSAVRSSAAERSPVR